MRYFDAQVLISNFYNTIMKFHKKYFFWGGGGGRRDSSVAMDQNKVRGHKEIVEVLRENGIYI